MMRPILFHASLPLPRMPEIFADIAQNWSDSCDPTCNLPGLEAKTRATGDNDVWSALIFTGRPIGQGRGMVRKRVVPFLFGCLLATAAQAQDGEGGQSLDQAANDPTASLMSVQLSDWYAFRYHNLPDGSDNAIVLRSAIPFSTGPLDHIFRVTAPIITDSPVLGEGLSDTTIFDLVVFNERWGRWGVGAVALLPTGGHDRGADQWALGPAVGFTARPAKGWLVGLFNQNLFRIAGEQALGQADINISSLQPILNHSLGGGWSLGLSEMQIVYDWDEGEFTNLPVGVSLSKLQRFGQQPVQFNVQYEHNFYDTGIGPSDTLRASVKFLFASGQSREAP